MFAESKTIVFRFAIFVGLASVVTTIIYYTPSPDVDFASCERPCKMMDWPMICRIKLTFEVYQTYSRSCGNCPRNSTDCFKKYCITADGFQRGLLTANRQLPGPLIQEGEGVESPVGRAEQQQVGDCEEGRIGVDVWFENDPLTVRVQVCENDIMLVDVVNRIPGQELAVHWRGQPQKETPVMDGVPMITQCPVPSYTTFQYKFRASRPGTHLWHAHTGSQIVDGLFGALIVRQADGKDPLRYLYDVDDKNYVVVVSDWSHGSGVQRIVSSRSSASSSDMLLINGRGQGVGDSDNLAPLAAFSVDQNVRYRLRIAYTGGSRGCPISVKVDGHVLTIIALDGNPVEPRDVTAVSISPDNYTGMVYFETLTNYGRDASETHLVNGMFRYLATNGKLDASAENKGFTMTLDLLKHPIDLNDLLVITLFKRHFSSCPTCTTKDVQMCVPALDIKGERVDAVLRADQANSSYWMRATTAEDCGSPSLKGAAVVQYVGAEITQLQPLGEENEQNSVDDDETKGVLYQNTVDKNCQSTNNQVVCLDQLKAAEKIPEYLSSPVVDTKLYLSYGFKLISSNNIHSLSSSASGVLVPHINNVTFTYPPYPLISQKDEVSPDLLCNKDTVKPSCHSADSDEVCECVHVIDIPLGDTVELVLVHQGAATDGHVFHLHGYTFHVVGSTQLDKRLSLDTVKELDGRGALLKRNLVDPVIKDTIALPDRGVAVIRFKADNPGYWLLHEERVSYWMNGLNVILHVGRQRDLPPFPNDFPTCGSWVGPELFLI
uniref:Laccase n=1 Tax=Timema monikensis TaxID=170555 RepID=A0A7R9E776_9NEOP|nr:unnamed protein product [Timema monikensis]